jgi:hypothetical protein
LDSSSDDRELEKHPGDAIFYTSIIFTGHFEFRPRTSAAMILTFSTTFIALIIGAVYTANLASFLVARRAPAFTIDSVEQAVLLRAPICVQEKVNIDDYLSEKYPKAVLVRRPNKDEILKSLKAGRCSVAVVPVAEYEQFSRYSSVNGDCSLKWSGKVEKIVPAGFASAVDSGVLCTSLISHVLDLHFIEMEADGFIQREWEAFLQRTGDHNCVAHLQGSSSSNGDETFSLGVQEMAGIFIIHTILLGLAVAVALLRYHRVQRLLVTVSQRHLMGIMHTSPKEPKENNDASNAACPTTRNDLDDLQLNEGANAHAQVNGSHTFADQAISAMESDDLIDSSQDLMTA